MSGNPTRVPAGIPTGGQFAAGARTESGVTLNPASRPVPRPLARRPGQDARVRGAVSGKTNRLGLGIGSVTFTEHFVSQAKAKGFTPAQVRSAVETPEKVTDVTRYPGQKRYIGAGIAVIIDSDTQHAITTYLDSVRTPLRPDQMNDPAALNSRRLNGHTFHVG